MKRIISLTLLLALLNPVFLQSEDSMSSESKSVDSEVDADSTPLAEDNVDTSPVADEGDANADAEADDDAEANEDAASTNRYMWNYDYQTGYHRHYGYYGCCDMNFWGRSKCCLNRPWSPCCGYNEYYSDVGSTAHHHDDDDQDHHKTLVLKTDHYHFDSPILSSSRSVVSIGGH
jgi:hypothetical protein